MGACLCKEARRGEGGEEGAYERRQTHPAAPVTPHAPVHHQRLANVGLDIKDLIKETLTVIRTLVNKLSCIALLPFIRTLHLLLELK